jgi:hypothetical protein
VKGEKRAVELAAKKTGSMAPTLCNIVTDMQDLEVSGIMDAKGALGQAEPVHPATTMRWPPDRQGKFFKV